MISTLLLVSSPFWIDIGAKQALVCDINNIQQCIRQFPSDLSLPKHGIRYREEMGLQHAMAIPVDNKHVSGLIITNDKQAPKEAFAILNNISLSLTLENQEQLALWHEQGHLENIRLAKQLKIELTNNYQHEWLADVYLLWRSVRETKSDKLAWQQFHRRNIEIIDDPTNLTHWSSPFLFQILHKFSVENVLSFKNYDAFLAYIYPKIKLMTNDEQHEIFSLVKHLFNHKANYTLPNYLFWRRAELKTWIKPTLLKSIGGKQTQIALKKLHLL